MAWRSTAAGITLLLSACSAVATPPTAPGQPAPRLLASSSGLCQAIAALPDLAAAERAFNNVAHEALHGLAADARLDRPLSARLLEAMSKVEGDFRQSRDAAVLTGDLSGLRASADEALQVIGLEAPACAE